jgi:hypothetical protein
MLVRLVVPEDASCRGTGSTVAHHMARNTTNDRTFNAALSICRSNRADEDYQSKQRNEQFHCESPCACRSQENQGRFGSCA